MQAVFKQLNKLYNDLQVVSGALVGICYGTILGIQLVATKRKGVENSCECRHPARLLSLVVVGECGIGKTSALNALCCAGEQTTQPRPTTGADLYLKSLITPNGRHVIAQVWDVGGHTECARLGGRFWRQAAGVVLIVRDIAELQLWHEDLKNWLPAAQRPIIVLWQPQMRQSASQHPQMVDWCAKRKFPVIVANHSSSQTLQMVVAEALLEALSQAAEAAVLSNGP